MNTLGVKFHNVEGRYDQISLHYARFSIDNQHITSSFSLHFHYIYITFSLNFYIIFITFSLHFIKFEEKCNEM